LDPGNWSGRRRWLLGETLVAASVAISVSIPILWRRRRHCISTELQIAYVTHIERIHVVANRHADMAGVTTQILAANYSSIAQGERVCRA
jgi:hypothetical protein